MDSDSDVQAYLNQLSKKTYSLKKDIESRRTPPSDIEKDPDNCRSLDEDYHPESLINTSKNYQQRNDIAGSINDIRALSDKYSDSTTRKSKLYDNFSNLEQKYLNKYDSSKTLKRTKDLRLNDGRKLSVRSTEVRIQSEEVSKNTAKAVLSVLSNSSSVDDLSNFLNDASLHEKYITDKQGNTGSADETWGEVLNVNNIITVENILGNINNTSDEYNVAKQENFRIMSGYRNSSNESISLGIDEEKVTVFTGNEKNAQQPEKLETNEVNDSQSQPVGILLAQASSNIFRSSRRKSSIEFNVENLAKLLPRQKDNVDPEIVSEENISSSESNVAESVVATEVSEEDPSVEENILQENRIVSSKEALEYNHEGNDSISYQSSAHAESGLLKSVVNGPSVKSSSRSSGSKCSDEFLDRHRTMKPFISSNSKGTVPKSSNRSTRISYNRSKRSKKKNKHRIPIYTSEWSDSQSSAGEHVEHCHGCKDKHKYRRFSCNHWHGQPSCTHCVHWSPHCCHSANASPSDGFTRALQSYIMKGHTTVHLGVEQIMKQQVALIRQFLECQQSMYQAYNNTLTTCQYYTYTTLRKTEKYIKKKRQPPLTFKEAYRLVKEEMESSEV